MSKRAMHQESYRRNEAYSEFLANWDSRFHAKYADHLLPDKSGGRALDVGCGVGQVLARLMDAGCEACGVDVSETSIQRARQICERAQVYDGKRLPFPQSYFDSAGALNVLEHVEQPEAFIGELARVVVPGGKIVLSSPNFFRVLGLRDYHPRMRGLNSKWRNAIRLWQKRRQMARNPDAVRFDRMEPIVKEPFTPDDDAIVATNPLEMTFFLRRAGCDIERFFCTDRYVFRPLDWVLNATPLRYVMFNAFVVARRSNRPREAARMSQTGPAVYPPVGGTD